jgi:hypothetical protein
VHNSGALRRGSVKSCPASLRADRWFAGRNPSIISFTLVVAGLGPPAGPKRLRHGEGPAIRPPREKLSAGAMDTRVKPAYDGWRERKSEIIIRPRNQAVGSPGVPFVFHPDGTALERKEWPILAIAG